MGRVRLSVPYTHPDFGKLFPCPNQRFHREETIAYRLAHSGLKDHERYKLDDLVHVEDVTREMVAVVRGFMAEPKGWLYLHGGYGVGKSVALMAAVYETIRAGEPAYYTTLSDLFGVMRAVLDPPKRARSIDESAWAEWDTFQSRFNRFRDMHLLAVDDFDPALINKTPFVTEFENRLLEHRYRDGVAGKNATIFAANKPPAAQPRWLTDRLEDGRFRVFENTGSSVRSQMAWWTGT
jgi:DNA replication protein DnaC